MKDKIAKVLTNKMGGVYFKSDIDVIIDQILALFPSLEGIEHVGLCHEGCPFCNGTGTISRQAEWGDIPNGLIQNGIECLTDNAFIPKTKSGGRLKVKKP
jgi:hypothetical protein